MGDDMNEMNPCECLFSHEMAMRRLLSFLRQSQTACTDTDCIDSLPGLTNPSAPADNSFSIMLMMWVMVATALFFMRPRRLRSQPDDLNKRLPLMWVMVATALFFMRPRRLRSQPDDLNKRDDNALPPPPPPPSAL